MVRFNVLSADVQLFASLTKPDPSWIAGISSTSLHIHQHGDDPSFTQVLESAGAVSRRQLQDLKLLRCPVQSKAGVMVELQHTQASCSVCFNKNLLTALPRSCSKRSCLTREKGFEY